MNLALGSFMNGPSGKEAESKAEFQLQPASEWVGQLVNRVLPATVWVGRSSHFQQATKLS